MSKQRQKYLRSLSKKEKERVFYVIQKLLNKQFDGLDVKPIVGTDTMWRCRVGNLRILFTIVGENIVIKKLRPRGDIY